MCVRHSPRFVVAAVIVALAAWLPLAARAGGTWKCKTADGGVAYVNNHLSDYHDCKRIGGNWPTPPKRTAKRGQWVYGESRAGEAPPEPAAPAASAKSGKAAAGVAGKHPHARILRGTMYKITRADGIPVYTNIKPRGHADILFHYVAVCYACNVHSTTDWATVPLNTTAFADAIAKAAAANGLDPSLLRALIHAESAFDPGAVSAKGAQGLTQLMPATASSLGVADPFDPAQNIAGGARYLAELMQEFGGDERLATAAFNAGPGAVLKYGGVPPYAETQVYVKRVGLLHQRYREAAIDAGGATASAR